MDLRSSTCSTLLRQPCQIFFFLFLCFVLLLRCVLPGAVHSVISEGPDWRWRHLQCSSPHEQPLRWGAGVRPISSLPPTYIGGVPSGLTPPSWWSGAGSPGKLLTLHMRIRMPFAMLQPIYHERLQKSSAHQHTLSKISWLSVSVIWQMMLMTFNQTACSCKIWSRDVATPTLGRGLATWSLIQDGGKGQA